MSKCVILDTWSDIFKNVHCHFRLFPSPFQDKNIQALPFNSQYDTATAEMKMAYYIFPVQLYYCFLKKS